MPPTTGLLVWLLVACGDNMYEFEESIVSDVVGCSFLVVNSVSITDVSLLCEPRMKEEKNGFDVGDPRQRRLLAYVCFSSSVGRNRFDIEGVRSRCLSYQAKRL